MSEKSYRNGIYEDILDPEQCLQIATATIDTKSNFRLEAKRQSGYDASTQLYSNAMTAGRWVWSDAAPIRMHYTTDGVLVSSDGLHRLFASAHSGVPLRTIVMFGPEYIAGSETDRGKNRTLTELLKYHGVEHNAAVVGAAVRYIQTTAIAVHRGVRMNHASRFVNNNDLLDLWMNAQDRLAEAARVGNRFRKFNMNVTATTVMVAILPDDVVDELLSSLDDADNQPLGNPWVTAARTARNHHTKHGTTMSTMIGYDLLCRAHEAVIAGETPSHFKLALKRGPAFPSGVDHHPYLPASMAKDADMDASEAVVRQDFQVFTNAIA